MTLRTTRFLTLRKYQRRARWIRFMARFLGEAEAIAYARDRGWISHVDETGIYLAKTGRWFRGGDDHERSH